jgi:Na+/proline symporter
MAILVGVFALVLFFYLLVRIGKASVLLAIGCFIFPPLLLLALGIYWKDEEHDIKVPFFVLLGLVALGNFLIAREERRNAVQSLLWSAQLLA